MDTGLSNEIYMAAINRKEEEVASHTHERVVSEYIKLARHASKLQDIIVSLLADPEYISRLREEIDELKSSRPGGRQTVYTAKERKLVLDMRKRGAVMREICETTGMSMSTVKRILSTKEEK